MLRLLGEVELYHPLAGLHVEFHLETGARYGVRDRELHRDTYIGETERDTDIGETKRDTDIGETERDTDKERQRYTDKERQRETDKDRD